MITVENLSLEDTIWFVEVAAIRMLIEEVKRPELADNPLALYNLANMGMQSETAWVAKKDGQLIGALGAVVMPNMFNPDLTSLAEVFWWVQPEYRTGRAGLMLLNKIIERGEELKVNEITLSLLPTSDVKNSALAKKGFALSEFGFRKEM